MLMEIVLCKLNIINLSSQNYIYINFEQNHIKDLLISYKELMVNALGQTGDEGRVNLR